MIIEIMLDCHEQLIPDCLMQIALHVKEEMVLETVESYTNLSGGGMLNNTGFRYSIRVIEDPKENSLLGYCEADNIHKGRAQKHYEMESCVNWKPQTA